MNPNMHTSLTLLHTSLVRLCGSGTRKDVFHNVQNENKRVKTVPVAFSVKTRWNSAHQETVSASSNQLDLDIAFGRMICHGGIDNELFQNNKANLDVVLPTKYDWDMWSQYECGTYCLRQYSELSQSPKVIFHLECFEGRMAMEQLKCPFFLMFENLSETVGVKDLTKRRKNIVVSKSNFTFNDCSFENANNAVTNVDMMHEIELCRRISYRFLGLRMNFFKKTSNVSGANAESDVDVNSDIMEGLENADRLPETKIVGAILHPLFQNEQRMVTAGLCTKAQFKAGVDNLIERMTRMLDSEPGQEKHTVQLLTTNEWDDASQFAALASPSVRKARYEFDLYCSYKCSQYLPVVQPKKTLGVFDEDGQPKKSVITLGPPIERGVDLPSKRNHADYIDGTGYYDIVRYLQDHKDIFPTIYLVGVGQFAAHISTEVDCESLFSEAGHLADPLRNRTLTRTFERLVIAKHRMQRIYCCPKKVHKEFMTRWNNNDWDDSEDREDLSFLEKEKKIYLEMYPENVGLFEEEESVIDVDCDEV